MYRSVEYVNLFVYPVPQVAQLRSVYRSVEDVDLSVYPVPQVLQLRSVYRSVEGVNLCVPCTQVAQLRSVYRSVEDVDLFAGGVAEHTADGALIGPTFQCLLAEQFTRLKYADRHFYNHDSSMFSDGELGMSTLDTRARN